ncbi:MAG TPA: putative F420-0 ABC transporter substrate-binding protein, partial [Isoptericola sp.]|nr:putative F420-0 ABC transporter substrate-binding protein [Isoptericola sp.]
MPRLSRTAVPGAAVLALSLAALAGCAQDPADATSSAAPTDASAGGTAYPLTLDNCGVETTVEAAPQRVVTVKSSTTEMLLALGLGDRIVGSAFLDGPVPDSLADAAADVPAVADPMAEQVPGAEAVLGLEPDLVYAGWESNLTADGAGDRATLAKLGVASYVSPAACKAPEYMPDPLTFDDVFAEIDEVGEVFDASDA